ncbi:uncharacterized protein LOC144437924 [Glandiceps talaboti]
MGDVENECQCDGVPLELFVDGEDGIIASEFYPRSYDRGLDCAWIITAPSLDDKITLTVINTALAPRGEDGYCQDYLRVYDGDSSIWDLIVEWCGTFNPEKITSTSTSLYIEFHTYPANDSLIAGNDDYRFQMMYTNFTTGLYCPDFWYNMGEYCYQLRIGPKTWRDAQLMCTYDAANLVSIVDFIEEDFVTETFGDFVDDDACVWIGMESFSSIHRLDTWIDDTNMSLEWTGYTYDMYVGHSLYACTAKCSTTDEWYRYPCDGKLPYICKKDIYGTTVRYPIPPVADFTHGLEVVAMVAVAILMTIFVGLFIAFFALRIKACRQISKARKMSTIQNYTAVNDNSGNGDDNDDDEESRTLRIPLCSEPLRAEHLKEINRNTSRCDSRVPDSAYEEKGAKPKRWLSAEFPKQPNEHKRQRHTVTSVWSPGDYEMNNLQFSLNTKRLSPTIIEPSSSYDYSILVPESPNLKSPRSGVERQRQNNNISEPGKKIRIFQV